jgi:outer membrane protein assembly factor BamA
MEYVEAYTTYTDNFLPFTRTPAPGGVRPDWWQTTGVHYRHNMYTPYWDPESGFWIDGWYGAGVARLNGDTVATQQARGELAAVRRLSEDGCCFLGQTRVAGRVVVEGASPDRGQFFALGGGTLFRGYDLAQRQGSFLWAANMELRFPVVRDARWDVLDGIAGGRNLYLAAFYDVGSVYADGRQVGKDVAHALGLGLRLDTAIFSFIERCTLRFDVGKTVNDNTPFQFWFGVQHAF